MKAIGKNWLGMITLSLSLLVVLAFAVSVTFARSKEATADGIGVDSIPNDMQALPNAQQRVHRMSDIRACLTNWGFVGSQMRDLKESRGGCFNPHPNEELPAPSFEYPAGSGLEYLFQGGIWIGARKDDTPYTSVGCDGWFWIYELWPEAGDAGAIRERSNRANASCYSPEAISDQDIIAVYTDTSADIPLSPEDIDPWDNRRHFPLGVKMTQKSYSWEEEGFDKFIITEYSIKNIGVHLLSDVYVGFYMDTDIEHIDENPYGPYGAQDDITGFLRVYEGDTVNIAWAADNDGHGVAGEHVWTAVSPRSVIGVKVLEPPKPGLQFSYNWWISNMEGYPKDWGPWKASNQVVWAGMNPYGSGNLFPDSALGTPGGDVSKYFLMSNGEVDYDQIYSCVWPSQHPEEGWLPPSPECADLANGYDTRFLLSFGPFDQIAPGEDLILGVAYVIGETLHVDPLNGERLIAGQLDEYYANLYFRDLVHNSLTAEKMYHDLYFNDPPDSFSLLLPPNKAFIPIQVHFDWETATDPNFFDQVRYDLYLSTSYSFPPGSTIIVSDLTTSEHTKTLNPGIYYWKVKAKDKRGAERWSNQIRHFIVTGLHYSSLGDFNCDGAIDLGDVVFSINYLFKSGSPPDPLELGDVNCDEVVDIGDVVYLINYLFKNGTSPSCP